MVEARACQVAERVERGGMNVGINRDSAWKDMQ